MSELHDTGNGVMMPAKSFHSPREWDKLLIEAQKKRIDELNVAAKRAFWWSAEFTSNCHSNNIEGAWGDFLTHPHAAPLDGAEP